jgi:hypothetical protein
MRRWRSASWVAFFITTAVTAVTAPVQGAIAQGDARAAQGDPAWNDSRTRAIVELATGRRAQQIADTLLADYQADARGYVTFLAQVGKGFLGEPKIVKVDQLAVEVYWRAPNLSKQRIIGRRDSTILPTDIQYHRDHLGIVQNNFPDIIRLGDGDEVRDVPHPLSAVGLREYDFMVSDSLRIGLPGRDIDVYEIKVRPKDDRKARVIGALYIEPTEGQVVRMAFNFTHAAFLDKQLEDLAIVLDNVLVGTRFWLPHRQEIEIRRAGTWLEFPFRGIIRGRWEIENYRFNINIPRQTFTGPEITQAPAAVQAAYPWQGKILDSLPADVRVTTDDDVRRVQAEARALVRSEALARAGRFAVVAPGVSQFAQVNRVDGLSFGGALATRFGPGFRADVRARLGVDHATAKWEASIGQELPSRSSWRLLAGRDFRDAGLVAERSAIANSIAAQEFGSDYTDPFDVAQAGLVLQWRKGDAFVVTAEATAERHRALDVRARPVTGVYEPTLPAAPLEVARATIRFERPAMPAWRLASLATTVRLQTARSLGVDSLARTGPSVLNRGAVFFRLDGDVEATAGWRRSTVLTRTIVAASSGVGSTPQELAYLGGPVSGPGYDFHQFFGRAALSQRVELQTPIGFPSLSLGRFGRTPGSATLAVFAAAVGVEGSSFCSMAIPPPGTGTRACPPRRSGFYPSAGLGLLTFFDLLRVDVARGFRNGRWTFNVDVRRDFWSVL